MSKSNPTLQNPCTKFINFKSDKGQFFFWNKETEQQVEIPLPIYFIVLDELSTVSGFNKTHESQIYSNEVHSMQKEVLRVKTFKGGESVIGLYNDIKDSIKALGGKYTKSVYALLVNPDKSTELVNFKFKGASFSAWLEKKINPMKSVIGITEMTEETNGNTVYQVPVFVPFKLTQEYDERAVKADEILQDYLREYMAQIPEKEIAKAEAVEETYVANQDWQGGSRKQELIDKSKANDTEEDDLPFN